jgi:hypothetical protein
MCVCDFFCKVVPPAVTSFAPEDHTHFLADLVDENKEAAGLV